MAMAADDESLFDTEWVHVFERDSSDGLVFVPADADIPLSRRPRERLVLRRDGTAELLDPGPDDRLVSRPATWREDGGEVVVRARGAERVLTIVTQAPECLVIRRR